MPKLTRTLVAAMIRDPEKDTFFWDSTLPGFGVKMSKGGSQSFVFQYRIHGASRRISIGRVSDALSCDRAREKAKEHAHALHDGIDPLAVKIARREAMTVAQLCDAYTASPSFTEKAESTQSSDQGRILRHIKPLLGNKIADVLTGDDVKRMRDAVTAGKTAGVFKTDKLRGKAKVKGGPGAARQCVVLIASIYEWARREKLLAVTNNPAADVDVEPIGEREVFLEGEQYATLFKTLEEMPLRPEVANAIRVIALTGARRGEITGLCWRHVDLDNARIVLPPSEHKTGRKSGKERIIALPEPVVAILSALPKGKPNDLVFPPSKGERMSLSAQMAKIRKAAELPAGVGLHGLRHSIASHMAMGGQQQGQISTVLGHRQTSTSERYIHFADRARAALGDAAAAPILAAIAGGAKSA
jgi:integrase